MSSLKCFPRLVKFWGSRFGDGCVTRQTVGWLRTLKKGSKVPEVEVVGHMQATAKQQKEFTGIYGVSVSNTGIGITTTPLLTFFCSFLFSHPVIFPSNCFSHPFSTLCPPIILTLISFSSQPNVSLLLFTSFSIPAVSFLL